MKSRLKWLKNLPVNSISWDRPLERQYTMLSWANCGKWGVTGHRPLVRNTCTPWIHIKSIRPITDHYLDSYGASRNFKRQNFCWKYIKFSQWKSENIKNYRILKKMQFWLTLSVSSVLHKEYISILERTASPFVFRRKHSPTLSLHTALAVCLYNCRHCRQREVGRVLPPEDEGGGCPL